MDKRFFKGVTIIEMITIVGISSALIVALMRFLAAGYPASRQVFFHSNANETARTQLIRLARDLRHVANSETGDYALVEMSPQRMVFFADVDQSGTVEKVRYELNGTDLERGIIKPSGHPPEYDPENEEVHIVASFIQNGENPIFIYYSENYPEDDVPLTPAEVTAVKHIRFSLLIDPAPGQTAGPVEVSSQVQVRSLKTNLGE